MHTIINVEIEKDNKVYDVEFGVSYTVEKSDGESIVTIKDVTYRDMVDEKGDDAHDDKIVKEAEQQIFDGEYDDQLIAESWDWDDCDDDF